MALVIDDGRTTLGQRLEGRDNALNFVRLCLASAVLVSHSFLLTETPAPLSILYPKSGELAVNGFFALSGYLIAGSRMRTTLAGFFWRRVLRIMPAFWVCLVVIAFGFAPVTAALAGETWSATSALTFVGRNILLVLGQTEIADTLRPGPGPGAVAPDWSGPLWTLAWEFGMYIVCALALSVPALRRRGALTSAAILGALWAYATILPLHKGDAWLTVRLGSFFAAGALCYFLRDHLPARWWVGGASAAGFLVLYRLGLDEPYGAVFLAVLLLWLGAVLPVRIGATNDISYGIYIYGWPIERLLVAAFPAWSPLPHLIVAGALTAALAAVSWFVVERRALRLKRWTPRSAVGGETTAHSAPRHRT